MKNAIKKLLLSAIAMSAIPITPYSTASAHTPENTRMAGGVAMYPPKDSMVNAVNFKGYSSLEPT